MCIRDRVTSYNTEMDVTISMVIDGVTTDETYAIAYGANGVVESASGILASPTPESAYPTIAPSDVVPILNQDHGFVFYGGVAPMAGVNATRSGASSSAGSTPGATGSSGTSSPPISTPTTSPGSGDTTTTTGPPVVDVDISSATLQLGTYVLTDGTTWLLPTWTVSGPESGTTITSPETYTANVLAVDAQYVHLAPRVMIF